MAIKKHAQRNSLNQFPCPYYVVTGLEHCAPEYLSDRPYCAPCGLLPVYRAHIKLRDDMRKLRAAVLGDMTAEEAAALYERAADGCLYFQDTPEDANKLWAIADVVAKL